MLHRFYVAAYEPSCHDPCPRSLMDKTRGFYPLDGGSIPPGGIGYGRRVFDQMSVNQTVHCQNYMQHSRCTQSGFSLIEVLITIAIITVIASGVLVSLSAAYERTFETRAKQEFRQIETALQQYRIDTGNSMPGDVNRNIPPGLEEYLAPGDWPQSPWPGGVYDWEAWDVNSDGITETYQISIRFCPLGDTDESECQFPTEEWASDFDYYSSVYWCIKGDCRSHIAKPADHPGKCLNCDE